ncbi:MAG: rubredoxin [Candidatus Parcubacteria bacterium]|nr:rubredoxin [Candidatus Parcubacteria bacterium]
MKWQCTICGYIFDEAKEGKRFEDLPDTWVCPQCGATKDMFQKLEEN